MQSAQYGSIRIGECLKEDPFDQIGCSVDVLSVLDTHCSGRRHCDMRVPNNEMDDLKTCKHDFTRYLEASYWCIKGNTYYEIYEIQFNVSSNFISTINYVLISYFIQIYNNF